MSDLTPSWGDDARAAYRESGLAGLQAYEDAACRRILTLLGLTRLARTIADDVGEITNTPACTFAAMDDYIHFPIKFSVGKISGVKFLTLPDLFDRFTTTKLFKELMVMSEEHGPDVPICLIFKFTGDTDNPGPKGGKFFTLHTFESSPILNTSRFIRFGKLHGQRVGFTLESLDSLMASFRGWKPDNYD
jgi:hypothetical protein